MATPGNLTKVYPVISMEANVYMFMLNAYCCFIALICLLFIFEFQCFGCWGFGNTCFDSGTCDLSIQYR